MPGNNDMSRILIFGNSGSGKSTLAKRLCEQFGLAHLDLDTLAWMPDAPPTRRPLVAAGHDIASFVQANHHWVIEGCYADLIDLAAPFASEMVFLDIPVEACITNARSRPWEPHKYPSKAAQDANLEMLLEWIRDYAKRDDSCSRGAHTDLFERFSGVKTRLTTLTDARLHCPRANPA
jgi:adenylate kinase family enzyme